MALPESVLMSHICDAQTGGSLRFLVLTVRAYACEAGARPLAHDVSYLHTHGLPKWPFSCVPMAYDLPLTMSRPECAYAREAWPTMTCCLFSCC